MRARLVRMAHDGNESSRPVRLYGYRSLFCSFLIHTVSHANREEA